MKRVVGTYYLLSGAYNLAQFFIWAIYPLFLLSRGLDVFQVNAVLAVYLITVFVFEIPTLSHWMLALLAMTLAVVAVRMRT